jgi:hypothetical protein
VEDPNVKAVREAFLRFFVVSLQHYRRFLKYSVTMQLAALPRMARHSGDDDAGSLSPPHGGQAPSHPGGDSGAKGSRRDSLPTRAPRLRLQVKFDQEGFLGMVSHSHSKEFFRSFFEGQIWQQFLQSCVPADFQSRLAEHPPRAFPRA